ncbi:hypothetical protein [Planctobacterium marinum]|uniref:DUF2834 domain-containing protein n=1 Tax=Planctobacterium marinum TaxID=1631968 RepID=A0AA48I496_9ALTE|nr:hypothetical protein MACH26_11610 [Planctobacterium marinum]
MNMRIILLGMILAAFTGFSLWVLLDVGYFGIWAAGFESAGTMQILFDLVISCLVFSCWMLADAKARKVNPWPWLLAILATGSIAILVYLLVREIQKSKPTRMA